MRLSSILIVYSLFISLNLKGQYAVQIVQPNELTLAARDLWNCIITNNTNVNELVYLHGTVTEESSGLIYNVNSTEFTLEPGITTFNSLNYALLRPETILFKAPSYEEYLIRTNELPRGKYTFCVQVINKAQNFILAEDCIEAEVLIATPPYVILPYPGDSICDLNPFFIWAPPQPPLSGPDVSYSLHVFEVTGKQTPEAAVYNNPAWYVATNIGSPIFQYGLEGRAFEENKTYAWYVKALEGKIEVAQSDIGNFIWYDCNEQDSIIEEQESKQFAGLQYFLIPEFTSETPVTVLDQNVNIIYISNVANQTALFRIEDINGKLLLAKDLSVKPGYNYITLDALEWKLTKGMFYTLSILNMRGDLQRLKFWYQPTSAAITKGNK